MQEHNVVGMNLLSVPYISTNKISPCSFSKMQKISKERAR